MSVKLGRYPSASRYVNMYVVFFPLPPTPGSPGVVDTGNDSQKYCRLPLSASLLIGRFV
jgi:hypothetical protein